MSPGSARSRSILLLAASALAVACFAPDRFDPVVSEPPAVPGSPASLQFAFSAAADMREFIGAPAASGGSWFLASLDALKSLDADGAGAFMLGPGDIDPPSGVRGAIDDALGAGFPWFPCVGNHEAETDADMAYLRTYGLPAAVGGIARFSYGPPGAENTMYSFDVEKGAIVVHFAVINEYYDGTTDTGAIEGRISPATYDWLSADLQEAASRSPAYLFVIGHEPAYPLPDQASGRLRHRGDSLDAFPAEDEGFIALLKRFGVSAYVCGHTHNSSAALVDGLLQVDVGHARGTGDEGAPSTFVRFLVFDNMAVLTAYRSIDGIAYAPSAAEVRIAPRVP